VGGAATEQLWLFWLAPIVGALIGGWVYRNLLTTEVSGTSVGAMRLLPGKQRPQWLRMAAQVGAAALVVSALISALPVLLMVTLVTALALIPTLRQLRKEMDKAGLNADGPARDQMVDITPIHSRVIRDFWGFWRRQR
jgi:predicted branched-subunit amino acid permease